MLLAVLNPVGSIASGVGLPFFAGLTLASVANQDGSFTKNIMFLTVTAVASLLLNRFGFIALMKLQAKTMDALSVKVFSRIMYRGVRFHVNSIGGKLVSDAFDYLQSYSNLTLAAFTNGASFFLTVIFGLLVIFAQSWQLGLFITLIVTISTWAAYYDSIKRAELRTVRHKATKKLVGHFSDSIVNAQTVKIFAAEKEEIEHNIRLNAHLAKLRLSDWARAGRNGNNRIAVLLFGVVILLVLLNYLTQNNPAAIGVGIFAFTYTFTLILRLFEINNITRLLEESFLNARPITEMLLEPIEIQDKPDASELIVGRGEVILKDISFHYEDNSSKEKIFEHFNLMIRPGERIGLVGPSGGGKSTLTKILLRFDDIQAGTIEIDGQIIADVTQRSLRRSIGYVPQEPLLFHRTIRENILYGKPDASEEELVVATKRAQALDFIEKLPDGFDTIVGERGVKLSGGQRQRVAIARVILKNAPLLILDEATSALDSESEVAVQKALDELMKGKTTVVIAHRLSTIQKMDRIVVLNDGKIVEDGPHKELVKKKNGLYARLWHHQSGGFIQE